MEVKLKGWRPGLLKVSLTVTIKDYSGLGLADSKQMVDDLLEGREVSVRFEDVDKAEEFKARVEELGVVVGEEE